MNELKPCPFCSGEAEVLESGHSATFYCWCDSCETRGNYYNTEAEAIEAWNSRAERTCQRVFYKPTRVLVCSECGCGMSKQLDRYCFLYFCPNCGAKVVR